MHCPDGGRPGCHGLSSTRVRAGVYGARLKTTRGTRRHGPIDSTLTCPTGTSERVFGDVRDLCATRANEIAESSDGHVTYLNNSLDTSCTVLTHTDFHLSDEATHPCDAVTAEAKGTNFVQYYPFNSVRLNFPGDVDYRPDLPTGILVIPSGTYS